MRVVGYTNTPCVAPGELLEVMVSTTTGRVNAQLVRLAHADSHAESPGHQEVPVDCSLNASYKAEPQALVRGSYVVLPAKRRPWTSNSLTVHLFMYPTTCDGRSRTIVSCGAGTPGGWALELDADARLQLELHEPGGAVRRMRSSGAIEAEMWFAVSFTAESSSGVFAAGARHLRRTGRRTSVVHRADLNISGTADLTGIPGTVADLLIGARDSGGSHMAHGFDGKVGNPSIHDVVLRAEELTELDLGRVPSTVTNPVAAWDFGSEPQARRVLDTGPGGRHGHTINLPARGVPGPFWDHEVADHRVAPDQFGAIHLHSDDLDDARWQPVIEWTVPDLPSGAYALRLTDEAIGEDRIPLFIRPRHGRPTSDVLFIAPVFSYLAYANEHCLEDEDLRASFVESVGSIDYPKQPEDEYIIDNRLHSLYDRHADGSGVCYSSWRRPLLSLRPGYRWTPLALGRGGAHQLNADLYILDWLRARGFSYDVVTDVELHREGLELLEPYRVVLTGSHPEYVSMAMLDALLGFRDGGGRIMYLGGNGFYWVTALEEIEGHTIEVRRWGPATRAWEVEPGAWHLSTTGELGGIWRMRGLAPQELTGVGFTAQGYGLGRPYRRTDASHDPRVDFVFAGLEGTTIGDHPNLVCGHGAAGVEIDRADTSLGTPEHALVLASAAGFTDHFQHAIEEVMVADSAQGGSQNDKVRADMVFFESDNGGAVFSVGSIAWSGSLAHNGYVNDVSRITENVLRRFLDPRPFSVPSDS
ncbi:hypothetical protein E1262_08790 [Jiangella aurantiaca]|uniref:N,N-dimethylformamidase beta subunit-like C-terminal domain-containing protein n=1 Tax=Jiangella aurantiaca TaxID=2530373 RepID=A0A4R5AID6_9ACTN|nr:N,N-dimethylformamidase beta subunit family domain-containing protein [Jiangella aurantiaca]TDD70734.1 hypothetical protein E1262_08790 [Jiangella aurantiaca]